MLGLCGEAGEAADKVKKVIRDGSGKMTPEIAEGIAYELGDALWYLTREANEIGYTLQQIASMNYGKLQSRQIRGVLGGSGDNR